ncbi:9e0816d0-2c46-44c0-9507-b0847a2cdc38 [Sclerotinia trifoliorum]|uniref:DNA polymerase lambda n=1 Tax=Sclerotinia trifoliorum TaxID=28548 RepID=A0A8H2VZ97_9HELO|nr:9e0816d0-2c46-44c0-9507-b0847a2cdc38 [Sclerotinia trifoliorum]
MSDKASFFEQLYALDQSDSDDGVPNESREFWKKCNKPVLDLPSQKVQNLLPPRSKELNLPPPRKAYIPLLKNIPSLQRSQSEPQGNVSKAKSMVNGTATAELSIQSSGKQSESRTTVSASSSFEKEISSSISADGSSKRPTIDQRSISNPTPAKLVLTNSTGIASMLSKKRKGEALNKGAVKKATGRKEKPLKLAPPKDRVFEGLNFFFLPNDDKSPVRRARIIKARERGAAWVRDINEPINYLIIDKSLTRKDVITYLKVLPVGAKMVNEEWLLDCIEQKYLYDPSGKKYLVKDPDAVIEKEQIPVPSESQQSDKSLQIKAAPNKPNKWEYVPPVETPERSQHLMPTVNPIPFPLAPVSGQQSQQGSSHHLTEKSLQLLGEDSTANPEQVDPGILNEAIELARATEGVLDHDNSEDDLTSTTSDFDNTIDESDSEDGRRSPLKAPTKIRRAVPAGKGSLNNFQCMTGGTASKGPNPNQHTIEILSRMREYYERIGDQWRSRSYLQACGQLKNQQTLIRTYDEAIQIPKIGQRIAKKIEEIVLTGRLLRLGNAEAEPGDKILKLFMGIYGVNFKLASKWISQGHRTFADLEQNIKLSPNQQIGIAHYNDLQLRIPRTEIEELGKHIMETAQSLDPDIEITIGGSYRRGAKSSGDIDIIITRAHTTSTTQLTPFLSSLVKILTDSHFLVAALAVPHNNEGSKWHGCCVLPLSSSSSSSSSSPTTHTNPHPWRRIDFLLVPSTQLGAALIYFTGDDIFNRSMRLLAGKKGMRLNQRGLYKDVMRGGRGANGGKWESRKKVTDGMLVEGRDEKRIFEILGVPWREPWERVCGEVSFGVREKWKGEVGGRWRGYCGMGIGIGIWIGVTSGYGDEDMNNYRYRYRTEDGNTNQANELRILDT